MPLVPSRSGRSVSSERITRARPAFSDRIAYVVYSTRSAWCENGAASAASMPVRRIGAPPAATAYPVRALTLAPGRFTRTDTRRYAPGDAVAAALGEKPTR